MYTDDVTCTSYAVLRFTNPIVHTIAEVRLTPTPRSLRAKWGKTVLYMYDDDDVTRTSYAVLRSTNPIVCCNIS